MGVVGMVVSMVVGIVVDLGDVDGSRLAHFSWVEFEELGSTFGLNYPSILGFDFLHVGEILDYNWAFVGKS